MGAFYASLNGLERFFALCAAIGGVTLLIRIVLMLIGADSSDLMDTDVDSADASISDAADAGFRIISLQGITGFFMMFGLVGLALSRQSQVSQPVAAGGGIAAGLLSMVVISWIFNAMTKLQSDGTLDIKSAVGQKGTVYLTIKPKQGGKVSITIQGRLCVLDAITDRDEPIPTGEMVEVVRVTNSNVLVVSPPAASEAEVASAS
jgi:membrane protein implicated in regulation of membrane protease activity